MAAVTRTLLLRSFAEQGTSVSLPWLPDGALLFNVVKAGFGVMDVVFLGIVLWEAWRIPGPVRLRT